MQSNGMMGAPPSPPQLSTLSSVPTSEGEAGNRAAGLPKLIFSVEQSLDTIAEAVPGSSEQIDEIKRQLRDLLTSALQGGDQEEASQTGYLGM